MKLIIPAALERKLMAYVRGVDAEIAGMGEVEMREDGNLWVVDLTIYDQEVTGGTADLSPEALAHFQTDLVKRDRSPKNWYLWWHSHNTFGAFFSKTDTDTIASSTEFDHLVSLVVNKKGERKCRLDMHRPFDIYLDNVTVEVAPEVNAATLELDEEIHKHMVQIENLKFEKALIETEEPAGIADEIKEKVKIKTYRLPARREAGFGKHGKEWLDKEFDPKWSKNRKKSGTVTVNGIKIRLDGLNESEIYLLVDETEKLIKAHVANGNGDDAECDELRADLITYANYLDAYHDASQYDTVDNNEDWDGDGAPPEGIVDLREYGMEYDPATASWRYPLEDIDDDHLIIKA